MSWLCDSLGSLHQQYCSLLCSMIFVTWIDRIYELRNQRQWRQAPVHDCQWLTEDLQPILLALCNMLSTCYLVLNQHNHPTASFRPLTSSIIHLEPVYPVLQSTSVNGSGGNTKVCNLIIHGDLNWPGVCLPDQIKVTSQPIYDCGCVSQIQLKKG